MNQGDTLKEPRPLGRLLRQWKQKSTCIWRSSIPYLFLFPSLAGTCVFLLIPFVSVIKKSFFSSVGEEFTGWINYIQVIHNQAFQLAAFNTGKFLAACIPLLLVISFAAAVCIQSLRGGRELYKSSLLIPMAIPAASIVLLWNLLFHQNGIINRWMGLFGGEAFNWIQSERAFGVLIFTYLWKNIGYDMVLWISGLSAVPKEQYEAAKIDGGGFFSCLFYITLPSLKGTVSLVILLSLIHSFQVFREAYLIAGDYPHKSIYMMQHLFNNWFLDLDIQKMSAASVMMLAVFLLPVFLLQKRLNGEK